MRLGSFGGLGLDPNGGLRGMVGGVGALPGHDPLWRRGLSFKPYLVAKVVQGLLCGGVTAIILRWFPALMTPAEGLVTDAILAFMSMKDIPLPALLTDGVFVAGWILSTVRGWQSGNLGNPREKG